MVIRAGLLAYLNGQAPIIAVEFARKNREVSAAKNSSSELEIESDSNNKSNAYNANIQKMKLHGASPVVSSVTSKLATIVAYFIHGSRPVVLRWTYKKGYGNWELSSDRAHATRRILENSNIKSDRFMEVNGRADKDPFNKKDTTAPENRRISITVLFDELQKQQQEDSKNNSVDAKEAETKPAEKPQ